jgi:pseudouridine-5'-phosphate glycosidase
MNAMKINNRASGKRSVALETTLLAHGVPSDTALP